jgi:hypothetical protein
MAFCPFVYFFYDLEYSEELDEERSFAINFLSKKNNVMLQQIVCLFVCCCLIYDNLANKNQNKAKQSTCPA